jgi:hypothetical protein
MSIRSFWEFAADPDGKDEERRMQLWNHNRTPYRRAYGHDKELKTTARAVRPRAMRWWERLMFLLKRRRAKAIPPISQATDAKV